MPDAKIAEAARRNLIKRVRVAADATPNHPGRTGIGEESPADEFDIAPGQA